VKEVRKEDLALKNGSIPSARIKEKKKTMKLKNVPFY
jgi:raffinose/stachyose/melibiose transport system permease protein